VGRGEALCRMDEMGCAMRWNDVCKYVWFRDTKDTYVLAAARLAKGGLEDSRQVI
jgi:hypothetical protein